MLRIRSNHIVAIIVFLFVLCFINGVSNASGDFRVDSFGDIKSFSISPNDEDIVLGADKGVFVMNFKNQSVKKLNINQKPPYALQFSGTGKYIAVESGDNINGFYDLKKDRFFSFPEIKMHCGTSKKLYFSDDDKYLFVGLTTNGIYVIDTDKVKVVYSFMNQLDCQDIRYVESENEKKLYVVSLFHLYVYKFGSLASLSGSRFFSKEIGNFDISSSMVVLNRDNSKAFVLKNDMFYSVDLDGWSNPKSNRMGESINLLGTAKFCPDRTKICFMGFHPSKTKEKRNSYFLLVINTETMHKICEPIKLPDSECLYEIAPSGKFVMYIDKGTLHKIDIPRKKPDSAGNWFDCAAGKTGCRSQVSGLLLSEIQIIS
ncbi:MAG: WD40 repeat domain-containing protein [Firmicutes bacterium]|nr:WD40 repeat domain-containing protein [Bacillota bacterium]